MEAVSDENEVRITKGCQILVEGKSDKLVMEELIRNMGFLDRVDVQCVQSKDKLRAFIRPFCKRAEFTEIVNSVGVLLDADGGPATNAFAGAADAIAAAKIPRPSSPGEFTTGRPRFGVYILPDNEGAGILEDLLYRSVGHERLISCVEQYIECAKNSGGMRTRASREAKAKVFAYLATQDLRDPLVGRAAQCGVWDWEHAVFEPLKAFLRELCGEAA